MKILNIILTIVSLVLLILSGIIFNDSDFIYADDNVIEKVYNIDIQDFNFFITEDNRYFRISNEDSSVLFDLNLNTKFNPKFSEESWHKSEKVNNEFKLIPKEFCTKVSLLFDETVKTNDLSLNLKYINCV